MVAGAIGNAGQVGHGVGALGGFHVGGDLLLYGGVDGIVDQVEVEGGGVGGDGIPGHSEGVGKIDIFTLLGGGDLEGADEGSQRQKRHGVRKTHGCRGRWFLKKRGGKGIN